MPQNPLVDNWQKMLGAANGPAQATAAPPVQTPGISPEVIAAFQRLFGQRAPSGKPYQVDAPPAWQGMLPNAQSPDEQAMAMRPQAGNFGQDINLPSPQMAAKIAQLKQQGYSDQQAQLLAKSSLQQLAGSLVK